MKAMVVEKLYGFRVSGRLSRAHSKEGAMKLDE